MAEDNWEDKSCFSLSDLEQHSPQVLIAGSGPAGTAVAEYLYEKCEDITIGILERGEILTTTHVNNLSIDRGEFMTAHEQYPWLGDFAEKRDARGVIDFESGGMMIFALGGRGIVAGAHLRRFYNEDFHLWDAKPHKGVWPIDPDDLAEYYDKAEFVRNVCYSQSEGKAQTWALGRLSQFNAAPPPWGLDIRSTRNIGISRGYDSSANRLWSLAQKDYAKAKLTYANAGAGKKTRRLFIAPRAYVTGIQTTHDGSQVEAFVCRDAQDPNNKKEVRISADRFVLAAGPIESARLFLNSGLGENHPAAGKYLAEHIYCRGTIFVEAPDKDLNEQFVNVVVPPENAAPSAAFLHRFHIHVEGWPAPNHIPEKGEPAPNGYIKLRITGEAAMDPSPENQVTIANTEPPDEYGMYRAYTKLDHSDGDKARLMAMMDNMRIIAHKLGGLSVRFAEGPKPLEKGRSHHEAGTLRMGHVGEGDPCVTDSHGRVHGIDNLFVADASLFPCVGVANPMLTVTALAYRVAEKICVSLKRGQP